MSNGDDRRANIRAKIEAARKASPSGTLGGATGAAGVKGSQQATGGGTTQIVVTPSGSSVVDISQLSKQEREAIEFGRKQTIASRQELEQITSARTIQRAQPKQDFQKMADKPFQEFTAERREAQRQTTVQRAEMAKAPAGEIRALSPEEIGIFRRAESPIGQLQTGFKKGFLFEQDTGQILRSNRPFEVAGALGGVVAGIVTAGKAPETAKSISTAVKSSKAIKAAQASKAAKAVKAVAQRFPKTASFVKTTIQFEPFIQGAGITTAAAIKRDLDKEEKAFLKSEVGKQAFRASRRGEDIATGFETDKAAIQAAKTKLEKETLKAHLDAGFTQQEAQQKTKEIIQQDFRGEVKDLFKERGYKGEALEKVTNRALQEQVKTNIIDLPFTDRVINPKAIGRGVTSLIGDEEAFKASAREFLRGQGFKGSELREKVQALTVERRARGGAEISQLLATGAASETLGRRAFVIKSEQLAAKGVTFTGKQAGVKLFSTGFGTIAPAGFFEGARSVIAQQQQRIEDFSLKKVLVGGGLGFASAGLVGGAIVGTSLRRPAVSKTIEIGSFITDPFEFGGDKLADVLGTVRKGVTGVAPKTPRIFVRTSGTPVVSFGGFTPTTKAPTPASVFTDIDKTPIGTLIKTQTTTPVQPKIPTSIKSQVPIKPEVPIKPQVPIKTQTDVPVPIPVETPIQIPPQVPINIQADIPVTSQIPTQVPVNIPTVTPIFRLPPPLPLPFGDLGGAGLGATARKGKRSKFINELEAGNRVLQSLLGQPARRPQMKKVKRRRSTQRVTKNINVRLF